jgi:hypothetical protein
MADRPDGALKLLTRYAEACRPVPDLVFFFE